MSRNDPGLGQSLRQLGGTVVSMVHSRLELASLEASDAVSRLSRLFVAGAAAVLLFGGAVVALSAWFAVAMWPILGHAVLGCLALAYAFGGMAVVWWVRVGILSQPALLAQTLAELKADAFHLRGAERDQRPADTESPRP